MQPLRQATSLAFVALVLALPSPAQVIDWSQRSPAASPSPRQGQAMVYDSLRGKTVLFGGSGGFLVYFGDTWEYDGTTWSLRTTAVSPSGRIGFAMAFDQVRGRVVLYGGASPTAPNAAAETWEYDGSNWSLRATPNNPGLRQNHAMAFDAVRNRVVLFGGTINGNVSGQTWEYDGSNWTLRSPSTAPQGRIGHAMAFDPVRNRTVMFGGSVSGIFDTLNDTWEWDGTTWTQAANPAPPPTRKGAAMSFDPRRGKVVMFGGLNFLAATAYQDTWQWDGTAWSQVSLPTLPTARSGHGFCYDTARGRAVLFGGAAIVANGTPELGDTWELNSPPFSSSATWSQRTATNPPSARQGHAMAHDRLRNRAVVFGGSNGLFNFPNETWEHDGIAWTLRTTANSPGGRIGHAMVHDTARGRMVLYGGAGTTTGTETWEYDGTNWTARTTAVNPGLRQNHAMVFDSVRNRVVLFGGTVNSAVSNETWEYDGTNWVRLNPATSPSARQAHAMAFDPQRNRTVLFGGTVSGVFDALNDTWEWNGTNWVQAAPAVSPPARRGHVMGHDASRNRTVVFGGSVPLGGPTLQDTWEWNGTNWLQVNGTPVPAARNGSAMAYDANRARILMFGGSSNSGSTFPDLNDLWEFGVGAPPSPNLWTDVAAVVAPPGRHSHAMVFHTLRGRTVLFGGATGGNGTSRNDTWEWEGTTWSQRSPATTPPVRQEHMMAYDSQRNRVVLFGGWNTTNHLNDTWEWDGTNWVRRTPASSPSPRRAGGMVYDVVRGRTVLFGGTDGVVDLGETWEWDGNTWTRKLPVSAPQARFGVAMVFDAARGRSVLFGGGTNSTRYADTWEWDGTNWIPKLTANGPSARWFSAMAFDVDRGIVSLFGGTNGRTGTAHLQDTWEWNGLSWSQRLSSTNPSPRHGHQMAYDAFRGRSVLFGGTANWPTTSLADTWELGVPGFVPGIVSFGTGCGLPPLTLAPAPGSLPRIGTSQLSDIGNVPAALAFMGIGLSSSNVGPLPLPLPLDGFGLTGCTLWQSSDVQSVAPCTTTGATTARNTIPIPNLPSMVGLPFFLQACAPAPGANPAELIVSNALRLVIRS